MATSSIEFAQILSDIPCDMCDASENVKSFCRECSFSICDRCKKGHARLHKNHTVVPVFDGIIQKQLYTVKCTNHKEKLIFFCKKCKTNICEDCLITDHMAHEIEKVSVHANILKQNLQPKIDTKKMQVTNIKEHVDVIKQREMDIKNRAKTLVNEIRTVTDKKRKMLDEEEKNMIDTINQAEKNAIEKLISHCNQLQDLNTECQKVIDSVNNELSRVPDAAVLSFVGDNESKLSATPDNISFDLLNLPVFTPSRICQENYLLGSLSSLPPTRLNIEFDKYSDSSKSTQNSTPLDPPIGVTTSPMVKTTTHVDPPPSLRRQLDLIHRFRPTGGAVYSICVADDGMLWVGTDERLLLLINEKGEEQKRVDMAGKPGYTCVTRSGDVLVSTGRGGQSIYKVTRQGQVSTFVDVSPGSVFGITATQDGDVFACVQTGSVYKVKKFTSEGKFVLELDSAMFTTRRQFRVHAVSGDTLCIQDGDPAHDDVCCLVTVTAAGQVASRVTRTGELREVTRAIVWDKYGNMLTGTGRGEYIHVFSGEGACKQSYKVEGSRRVWTLCLGKDDVVWIGTDSGEVIKAKYLQ